MSVGQRAPRARERRISSHEGTEMTQISVSTRRVVGGLRHWIYPSHHQIALIAAIEAGVTVLGLPLWAHVLIAAAVHWPLVGRRW